MTTTERLKESIIKEVERAYQIAEDIYGRTFDRAPVTFSLKGEGTAGEQWYNGLLETTCLDFNLEYAYSNQDFVNRTPSHEVAHQIAMDMFGEKGNGHGRIWKRVHKDLGGNGKATHSYLYMGKIPEDFIMRKGGMTYYEIKITKY